MTVVRFMHVSDTHLGAKEYSMDVRELDVYEAFSETLDIAIDERVDFIAHSGDLFDVWSPSNRSLTEFKNFARKINEKNIPFFVILGDHDRPKRVDYPAAKIFDFLGVHLLGTEEFQHLSRSYGGEEIMIGGISNIKGLRRENLPVEYKKADLEASNHKNSILLSHQAVFPYFYPQEACEIDKSQLPYSFSYLAFGHVHDSFLTREGRTFAYAGSTEIASSSEIRNYLREGKGVNIVDITRGEVDIKRIRLKSTRPQFSIQDATPDDYLEKIDLLRHVERTNEKKPLLSITITGECNPSDIISNLRKIDDFHIRFPPSIRTGAEASKEEVKNRVENSIIQYLERYFGDHGMAELADSVMKTIRSEEQGAAFSLILKKLGIEFLEENNDHRIP